MRWRLTSLQQIRVQMPTRTKLRDFESFRQDRTMIHLIEEKREALEELCRRYRVRRLEIFGSAATGAFDDQRSDLDFLVEFHRDSPMGPFSQYFGFLEELEELFATEVDLVEADAMRNPHFIRAVNATRTLLYAA